MEEINSPKKERKFLKAVGKVAGILIQEFVLGLGRKFIGKKLDKINNKRQALLIFLALFCNIAFASIDSIPYPITTNKQRLGWQTSGNGLVYRGRASDTITKPSNYANKDIKAYMLVDTVNNVMYSYIASKGGWKFNNSDTVIIQGATMPFDSITFNTAKDGTVGVGEVEYNDTQGSLIQGLKGGNVTNIIGQQLHQRVNNRTGATLNKGDVVYLSGSQGNRITVAKAIATSDPTSANTFGIVAESIADNASGYVITEGLITGLNTSALIQDSAVYLSGTTAGALTSTKPQAPIHGVYIGVCVKSNAGSGEIFVKIRNGQELDELHDVQITSPVNNASLYYKSSEGLWRDTTAALLVSDTASMLTNYLRSGTAANTYLPLTGGTLTGALNGTTGTFTGLNVNNTTTEGIFSLQGYDNNTATRIQFKTDNIVRQEIIKPTSALNLQFRSYPTGTAQGGYEFYVSNGSSESLAATIATDKSLSLTGSLGVTGATTLSSPLTVNSSAVFNENSADADFRVESDGNANMVFVDASTDRVGIGYASPTKTLDVNGTLGVFGATTLSNTLAVTGNIAAGLSSATAALHLKAGTSSASSAPLKFTSGTNMTTAEAGAMEFNGTNLLFTPSTTRHTVNHGLTASQQLDFPNTSTNNVVDIIISVPGAADGDVVSLGVPNAVINALTFYTAWVSGADSVSIRFTNLSGGDINPPSATFKVFVTK